MSDEIVLRLRNRSKKSLEFLKESLKDEKIFEADDEEKDPEESEAEDAIDAEPSEEEAVIPEEEPTNYEEEETPADNEYVDPDGDTEAENQEQGDEGNEYVNPLDNKYAVKHTIGDPVLVAYSNGTNSKLKGEIDGYDKEGFYRIRWSNGLTTNGITDLAIAEFVGGSKNTHESKCVCGHSEFITEGKYLVCDACGRKLREATDTLTVLDKQRPRGKRMIRSEAHPISTSAKPNISEAIKKAFKEKKSLNEESSYRRPYKGYEIYSPTEEEDFEVYIRKDGKDLLDKEGKRLQFNWIDHAKKYIDSLNESEDDSAMFKDLRSKLEHEFWTRRDELIDSISALGYEVLDDNDEYIVIEWEDEEGDEGELQIPLGGTSRTITLDFNRARFFAVMS